MNRSDNSKPFERKERLKMMIARVADSGSSLYKRDIQKLVSNVLSEDSSLKEYIITLFSDCIENFSYKSSVYATTVVLISANNQFISEGIVDQIIIKLQCNLDDGNVTKCKSCLLFLGDLMNQGYLNSLAFINLLSEILREAEGSLSESLDFYLYLALSVLPYTIDTLKSKSALEFNSLAQNLENLMNKRNTNYLELIRVYNDSTPNDNMTIMWKEIQKITKKESSSELKTLSKPYELFADEIKNIKPIKRNHKLNFSTKKKEKCKYQSGLYIDLIDEGASNEENETLDQILIKELIQDLLIIFHKPENIAREFSKLIMYNNYNYLVVEGIFSALFQINNERNNPGTFTSIIFWLIDLLKVKSLDQKFKNVMNIYMSNLLQKLDILNYDATQRFCKLYVNYITINGFEIDWEAWRSVIESEKLQKKNYILKIILSDLCFTTYYDKIEELTPINLRNLLPLKNPASFAYEDPSAINNSDVEIIKDKIAQKLGDFEMLTFLKSEDNNLDASGESLLELFLQCFLNRSCKSLTHFDVTLERYKNTLSFLIGNESDQIVLLNTIKKFWQKDEYYLRTYIEYFESKSILKTDLIIDWLFSELKNENDENTYSLFCWDFLLSIPLRLIRNLESHVKQQPSSKKQDELRSKIIFNMGNIFKKSLLQIYENSQKNSNLKSMSLSKFGSFARRYKNELIPLLFKLEEDNIKLISQDISKILSSVKLLV